MKIAYYCSNRTVFPPPANIVAANATVMKDIAKKMIQRGHQVTIYASKGSKFPGAEIRNLDLLPHNLDGAYKHEEFVKDLHAGYRLHYISKIIEDSKNFDLIHLHVGRIIYGLPLIKFSKAPVVFTMHENLPNQFKAVLKKMSGRVITISKTQAKSLPKNLRFKTIYHGIDTKAIPFTNSKSENFLFLGRLAKEKGVQEALELAKKSSISLNLYGPVDETYYLKEIKKYLDLKIKYFGMAPKYSRIWHNAFLNCRALILPITWEEPFGLVMIEAMAHGTPIIAYNRGSVSEIVQNGRTGFIVPSGNQQAFIKAINTIKTMPQEKYQKMRENCRQRVENFFSLEKMIDNYEQAYAELISKN